jgi:ankyrin repeat protein
MKTGAIFAILVLARAGSPLTANVTRGGEARTDINARGQGGLTALDRAVNRNDISSVLALIQAGADVNVKSNTGRNPSLLLGRLNMASLKLFEPWLGQVPI